MPLSHSARLIAAGLALLAALAIGFGAAWTFQGHKYKGEIADIRLVHAEAYAQANAQARSEEARRVAAIEGIRRDAQIRIEELEADAATAVAAAGSLRKQVDLFASRPAKCPAVADGGAADSDKLLLAQLLSEADEAAGRMAAEADRSRVAGLACEKSYDALSGS